MRIFMGAAASIALTMAGPALAQEKGNEGRGPERALKELGVSGKGIEQAGREVRELGKLRGKARQAGQNLEGDISSRVQRARREIRNNIDDARQDVTVRENDALRPRDRYEVYDDGRLRFGDRRRADYGLIDGCPPGLAQKNDGCLPPGQARQFFG